MILPAGTAAALIKLPARLQTKKRRTSEFWKSQISSGWQVISGIEHLPEDVYIFVFFESVRSSLTATAGCRFFVTQEALLYQEVCTKAAVIGKRCLPSAVQMGSCRRSRYVSWCEESAESPVPVPIAVTATGKIPHTLKIGLQSLEAPLRLLLHWKSLSATQIAKSSHSW